MKSTSKVFLFVALLFVGVVAAGLTNPEGARAHNGCTLSPLGPGIGGSFPNQYAYAYGNVNCNFYYEGDIRLRGWNGSSWVIMKQVFFVNTVSYPYATTSQPCYTYNYVDTFMYANFAGHGHTNNTGSAACNFP
jgi:hypothetical protein